ncbi:MAG: MbcA/ParS/Xre antitoxin family protein [Hydrogenophaga sp.]|uniref:MbcA/ParS/Xre antitoxin family protein n=1 Tax=Hydrogenophaga sp. TaxID=1904254 RepID=UPI0034555258|nr:MbcA/ParS/Xre antitoxin family protein [Hydrogenophaga sp.]
MNDMPDLRDMQQLATDVFGKREAADWIQRPHPMLEGKTPSDAAATSLGLQRVMEILVAIKYGGVV